MAQDTVFWDGFWGSNSIGGGLAVKSTTVWQYVVLNTDDDGTVLDVLDFGFTVAKSEQDALVQIAREQEVGKIIVKPFA